jgi:hypothetical protein
MDVPDRLPFEVLERLFPEGPSIGESQHIQQPFLVMATKGAGTVRPFVRIAVLDLLLYQSLVDAMVDTIEGTLGSRDRVFAYRQAPIDVPNQFDGSPKWSDYNEAARVKLAADPDAFAVKADIAGYFMRIDVDELERLLLERGVAGGVARDLRELLVGWHALGVRGIPQGVPPSSPLGNVYLAPIDQALDTAGLDFMRYMDDTWIFTPDFADARRAQDFLERVLYDLGLTLSGEKSVPMHRRTALEKAQSAVEVLEQHQELFKEGWMAMLEESYADDDELPPEKDINAAAILDVYESLLRELRQGEYPEGFRPLLRNIYRELRAGGRPDVISDVPELLTRFPDLTGEAVLYVGRTGSHDAAAGLAAFSELLQPNRFHREQELVEVFHAALSMPPGSLEALTDRFAEFALKDSHPLVRARALLAWGAHSAEDDFQAAEGFWKTSARTWRIYPFVAIQDKEVAGRNERYELWSAEGRFLEQLGESLVALRFSWRRI